MTAVEHGIAEAEHSHYVTNMQQPETAKNIHVYLNGDKFYPGRKFVVNRRHIADFDGFLNQASDFISLGNVQISYMTLLGEEGLLNSVPSYEGGRVWTNRHITFIVAEKV